MFQSNKNDQISFFSDSAILGSTHNDQISESKKLLVLPSKRFLGCVLFNQFRFQ